MFSFLQNHIDGNGFGTLFLKDLCREKTWVDKFSSALHVLNKLPRMHLYSVVKFSVVFSFLFVVVLFKNAL